MPSIEINNEQIDSNAFDELFCRFKHQSYQCEAILEF